MIIYGIPNCNTVKKATTWLQENNFAFEFHDFKKKGISAEQVKLWCETVGWEIVLNKKGTTWKKLPLAEQLKVVDEDTAVALMVNNTSAIKRPIIEVDGKPILISFNEDNYMATLK
jgi:arsenate reductase